MKKDKNYDNQILKQAFAFPDADEMEVAMILVNSGNPSCFSRQI